MPAWAALLQDEGWIDLASGFRLCLGLLHMSCFGTKLKGHASWGMVFSLWYRKVRGLVKSSKHVWNLCSIMCANIPLVRESHMTKTAVSGACQFTLPPLGYSQVTWQRERVMNWEQQSKSTTHFYNHMLETKRGQGTVLKRMTWPLRTKHKLVRTN